MKYNLTAIEILKIFGYTKQGNIATNIKIPSVLHDFLSLATNCSLFSTSDIWVSNKMPICFLYDDIEEMIEEDEYSEFYNLPKDEWKNIVPNYLLIGSDFGSGIVQFGICDLDKNNPPVYMNHECDSISEWKLYTDSLSDFLMQVLCDVLLCEMYDTAIDVLEEDGWNSQEICEDDLLNYQIDIDRIKKYKSSCDIDAECGCVYKEDLLFVIKIDSEKNISGIVYYKEESISTKDKIQSALKSTKLPSIHISVSKESADCADSKFGGDFYVPDGQGVPTCPEGEEMQFIAQINFAQIPHINGFPKKGLLQFFIDTNETRFLEKIDEPDCLNELYTLRYYPDIDLLKYIEQNKKTDDNSNIPWFDGKMLFSCEEEVATVSIGSDGLVTDLGYEKICKQQVTPELVIKQSRYDIENSECAVDDFCFDFGNWGTKIGGHPSVHQSDSRSDLENGSNYNVLLFQYDFTTRNELEADTFQFFIKSEDLENAKFDDVLFCWHNCF